jgi:hypothetical protein
MVVAYLVTSASLPVATTKTNPRTASVRDERTRLDTRDRLAHVGLRVGERFRRPGGLHPDVVEDGLFELVIGEGEHPAVGVVDEDDLGGAEQPLADRERISSSVTTPPAWVARPPNPERLRWPSGLARTEVARHTASQRKNLHALS